MSKLSDILGINARNLNYIRPSNMRSAVRLADDKLKTKKILQKEGIPVQKLYGIIQTKKDLDIFDWNKLPDTFVLKPNMGLGGGGIVVIRKREEIQTEDDKKKYIWFEPNGDSWTIEDFKVHILDILDGNYSIAGMPDVAFFEKKIVLHPAFRKYTWGGIPDIRVIVYNKIPVMSMARLPTKRSNGKANLALGAVGVGIDLLTGVTTTAAIKKPRHMFLEKHPDTKQKLQGLEIPFWNEILEIAIRCQEISKLGYLGVDIVLDKKDGPVVLELNARAGLEIQNVNLAPLRKRLQRVEGLKVESPQKGIRIAQDLFGRQLEKRIENISGKQIIGLIEPVQIRDKNGNLHRIIARIDTGAGLSSIDEELAKKLGLERTGDTTRVRSASGHTERSIVKAIFYLSGQRLDTKLSVIDRSEMKYKMLIGRKDLKNFLVDSEKKEAE